jgi:hypothetical protein
MSDWLTDFLAEFKPFAANILGVPYPPTAPNTVNILTTIQGQQHNFVEMLNNRAGVGWQFVPPGFIIDVGDFVELPTELGMSVQNEMRAPITIVFIENMGGASGIQNYVYEQMFLLKQAIEARPSTFQTFTRIEQGKLMSSVDCPINKELMGDSQVSVICSALTYTPGFLVQLY